MGDGVSEGRLRMVMREELEPMQRSINKIKVCLEGPEGDPSKGVIVRLDRVEQTTKRWSWWTGTALVAGIGAATNAVVNWITGKATS